MCAEDALVHLPTVVAAMNKAGIPLNTAGGMLSGDDMDTPVDGSPVKHAIYSGQDGAGSGYVQVGDDKHQLGQTEYWDKITRNQLKGAKDVASSDEEVNSDKSRTRNIVNIMPNSICNSPPPEPVFEQQLEEEPQRGDNLVVPESNQHVKLYLRNPLMA